jgi:hypothetical protein
MMKNCFWFFTIVEAGNFPEAFDLQLFGEAEKILEEVFALRNLARVDEPDDVFDGAGIVTKL